jgi:hypothetical protein
VYQKVLKPNKKATFGHPHETTNFEILTWQGGKWFKAYAVNQGPECKKGKMTKVTFSEIKNRTIDSTYAIVIPAAGGIVEPAAGY